MGKYGVVLESCKAYVCKLAMRVDVPNGYELKFNEYCVWGTVENRRCEYVLWKVQCLVFGCPCSG